MNATLQRKPCVAKVRLFVTNHTYGVSDRMSQVLPDQFVGTWIASLVAVHITVEHDYTALLLASNPDHPILQFVRTVCDTAVFTQSPDAFVGHRLILLRCE